MNYTILDCYTDEPSGLGVPPYLGVYPRYIYGYFRSKGIATDYLTIDDLRLLVHYRNDVRQNPEKTNIRIYNLTRRDTAEILAKTGTLIILLGVHVPGKYLSALPGTAREVLQLTKDLKCRKILTGPGIHGTQLEGGRFSESSVTKFDTEGFDFSFEQLKEYAVKGAGLVRQIPDLRIAEIECARGCNFGRCSFCTEPLKSRFCLRPQEDILREILELYRQGIRHFRLGKQSDFYSIDDPVLLLRKIRDACPDIKVLHIDNVNPVSVVGRSGIEITQAIAEYCTEGNVAALGVESFDAEVGRQNSLNCTPEIALRAVRIINEYGSEKGKNGMPKFLPGINILFGLAGESKLTHEANIRYLRQILDEGLLLRRINIRQVALLPGTRLAEETRNRFLKKNRRHYWRWRNEIRQQVDLPMLKRLVPEGSILKEVYSEIYDGNTTFARQIGTYALIVGLKGRLPLKKFYTVSVTGHMLRSISGIATEQT